MFVTLYTFKKKPLLLCQWLWWWWWWWWWWWRWQWRWWWCCCCSFFLRGWIKKSVGFNILLHQYHNIFSWQHCITHRHSVSVSLPGLTGQRFKGMSRWKQIHKPLINFYLHFKNQFCYLYGRKLYHRAMEWHSIHHTLSEITLQWELPPPLTVCIVFAPEICRDSFQFSEWPF